MEVASGHWPLPRVSGTRRWKLQVAHTQPAYELACCWPTMMQYVRLTFFVCKRKGIAEPLAQGVLANAAMMRWPKTAANPWPEATKETDRTKRCWPACTPGHELSAKANDQRGPSLALGGQASERWPGCGFLCGDMTCGVCVSSAVTTCGACVSSRVTAAKRGWRLSARLEAGLSQKRLTSAKNAFLAQERLTSTKRGWPACTPGHELSAKANDQR